MMATTTSLTGAQFDSLPYEDGRRYELLSGDLVEVSSPPPEHQDIVFNLLSVLKNYAKLHSSARAHQDVEFAPSATDRLRPDICVLLNERAKVDRSKVPIEGAPNIAVEVISQTERAGETRRKVLTYLEAGVQEVWQVYPITQEVLINSRNNRRELQEDQLLTTELLPGFEFPVASIFN